MKKSLLLLCFLSSFVFSYAQGGGAPQTGVPQYDLELIAKCHDDGAGNLTQFYTAILFTVGNTTPDTSNYLSDATPYTIPGTGTVSDGSCGGDNQSFDYEVSPRCDDGVLFFEVLRSFNDGTDDSFVFLQIGTNGQEYTPVTANPIYGFCNGAGGETVETFFDAGTIDGSTLTELTIVNEGTGIGTFTVGAGTPQNLYPGQTYYDGTVPVTDVSYDATGTQFKIVTTQQ